MHLQNTHLIMKRKNQSLHDNRKEDSSSNNTEKPSLFRFTSLTTTSPVFLDENSFSKIETHCNTIYTGSRIRVWNPVTRNLDGRIAYVHWGCDEGLFLSFEDTNKNELVKLHERERFVVDNRAVQLGALRVMKRYGTDDMADDRKQLTRKEQKTRHEKVLMNDIIFRFPTNLSQQSYECTKFKRTCWCEYKKRPKIYFCASTNEENAGKAYYGCRNRLTSTPHCNFFAWENEFDHGFDKKCECGHHCKQIEYPKGSQKFYLVCFEKREDGCRMFQKVTPNDFSL